jgi:hypothetical protein
MERSRIIIMENWKKVMEKASLKKNNENCKRSTSSYTGI